VQFQRGNWSFVNFREVIDETYNFKEVIDYWLILTNTPKSYSKRILNMSLDRKIKLNTDNQMITPKKKRQKN